MRAGDAGVIAQLIDELFGGIRADICHKQRVFDILPISFRQVILGENVEQGFAEGVRAVRQARLQTGHAGSRRFRGGFGRNGGSWGGRRSGHCRRLGCRRRRFRFRLGLTGSFSLLRRNRRVGGRFRRSLTVFTGLFSRIDALLARTVSEHAGDNQRDGDNRHHHNRNNLLSIHTPSLWFSRDRPDWTHPPIIHTNRTRQSSLIQRLQLTLIHWGQRKAHRCIPRIAAFPHRCASSTPVSAQPHMT